MFQSHNIIYFKKYYTEQTQMPTTKPLQEIENVYKIYDLMRISDSYELQMRVVKEIAKALIRKIKK